MKSTARRKNNEKAVVFLIFGTTAAIAFLAGCSFSEFTLSYGNHEKTLKKREVYNTVFEKRNFESKDQTPDYLEFKSQKYHAEGLSRINSTYIESMLK